MLTDALAKIEALEAEIEQLQNIIDEGADAVKNAGRREATLKMMAKEGRMSTRLV